MNCKPGDLARYVGIHTQHRNKYVVVLGETQRHIGNPKAVNCPVWWEISPAIDGKCYCADSSLRPVNPGEGNESWFKAAPLTEKPKQPEAI